MRPPSRLFPWALLWPPILASAAAFGMDDWPQWRGPHRDNVSRETSLLDSWPDGGPPPVWRSGDLGEGFGSVSTQRDLAFVLGSSGRDSILFCLSRADGRRLWAVRLGPNFENDMGGGPRSTPTVDGDRVYALLADGTLSCRRVSDGGLLWRRNILDDFGARNIHWGVSESPLVDGERLIVTPGGDRATVAALNKISGDVIWRAEGVLDQAAYASVVAGDVGPTRVYMTFTSAAGIGVRASDGRLLWHWPRPANSTANIATPVFHDGKVFYTSGYNTGGGLLELIPQGDGVQTREVYFNPHLDNHHGGVVLLDGHLYGFFGSTLACADFLTGEIRWQDRSVGKGSLTAADGHLYLLSENNVLGLAEATPAAYVEKGRFTIEDRGRPSWAHPVLSDGRLYVRNRDLLLCFDVRRRH